MTKEDSSRPAGRPRYNSIEAVAAPSFKSCGQSRLPDNRLFKGDLRAAAIQVRQAQLALQDALYVLQNQLEEALDRDEERRC